jgi:hypothetical protein
MPRSPIEIMIDQACGVVSDQQEQHPIYRPSALSELLLAVADAAEDWYMAHSKEELAAAEQALTAAVAKWLDAGGGKKHDK